MQRKARGAECTADNAVKNEAGRFADESRKKFRGMQRVHDSARKAVDEPKSVGTYPAGIAFAWLADIRRGLVIMQGQPFDKSRIHNWQLYFRQVCNT